MTDSVFMAFTMDKIFGYGRTVKYLDHFRKRQDITYF